MKIHFNIHYKTQWGQTLDLLLHNSDGTSESIPMEFSDKFIWSKGITVEPQITNVSYQYVIKSQDKPLFYEYGGIREIQLSSSKENVNVQDTWRTSHGDSPFTSAAFSDCFFKRKKSDDSEKKTGNLTLRINCPEMEPNRHFAIVGNQEALGDWDVIRKIKLNDSHYPVWNIELDTKKIKFPIEYKYLIVDSQTDEVVAWGGGPNRVIANVDKKAHTIVTDEHFIRTIPSWKAAGVAIPVFSLRSNKGFGIGEFNDLKKLIDWTKQTGQKIIQTLPINDTVLFHTNTDSYPYNAVSVHALHPIYLRLEAIGKLKTKKQKDYFEAKKTELNAKSFLDYQQVMNLKWEYFNAVFPQESPVIFASDAYKKYFEANKSWLVPYAVFSYLRNLYGTPEFVNWAKFSVYNSLEVEEFALENNTHYQEIAIFYFLQYHLHLQLKEVHDYARANGIAIKGDIPIGVSPYSVDVWVEPNLFNTNVQAGAPPDEFSVMGQNWGFPTYNWDEMEKDGFLWWKKRFQKLAEYFDAYRIDHILGFFRIWEIPFDAVWGLTGSFNPSLPISKNDLQAMGLWWDDNRYLKPYLKEHVLYEKFGKYTEEVIQDYFLTDGWQSYKFKPEFDSQKKIETYFAENHKKMSEKQLFIRDGLYQMHTEIIFVRDARHPDRFHPRISMHSSHSYRDLYDDTRRLLDWIYVDYYYRRHTDYWKKQALKKLPALISSTNMLVCGEDLGMVPDSVPDVMNSLEIISLEIQRMPKKSDTEFAMPAYAPYHSVCTTGTHDMSTLRGWWEENRDVTQRFYNNGLGLEGKAPEFCETWIVERIIQQHLYSPAMLTILPWQDWMGIDVDLRRKNPFDERINVPSNPHNFWCYRMHITLEQLLKEYSLNYRIKEMIENSGR